MNKIKKLMTNGKAAAALCNFAVFFVAVAANARCGFHLHQPQMPESAKRFRKH